MPATAKTAPPETFNLPFTRSTPSRVPAHLSKDRRGAHPPGRLPLPQVVKPADYISEGTPASRCTWTSSAWCCCRSRWPARGPAAGSNPALMDSALAHLDAVGSGRKRAADAGTRAALEAWAWRATPACGRG
jgi:ATP-dependent RNA helicase SUPV3L1/SUV3